MLSMIIRFCSISIIFNVKFVKLNTTETVQTTEAITPKERTTRYPSLDLYDWEVFCKFQANAHDCVNDGVGKTRYYYDTKLEDCTKFVFGGCPSNQRNVFRSLKECTQTCREPGKKVLVQQTFYPNVYCRFQPDFGSCHDYQPRFYFDVTLRKCAGFSFSGCEGNQNRFRSEHECQHVCNYAVDAYGEREMSDEEEDEHHHIKYSRN